MRNRRVALLVALAGGAAMAQDWTLWSPRAEIAPRASRTGEELVLEGGGNAAVFGGWERTTGDIKSGQWYRFRASYRAAGLTNEPFQVIARLDWQSADGHRAGQPDYAWRVESDGDWRTFTLDVPAPAQASQVKMQLFLENAPGATLRWKNATLAPIATPASRPVTISTIRLKPRGPDPVDRFIRLIDSAVPAGVDMIVLPEGITGVGTGRSYFDSAETFPGPTTERLSEVARKRHAWIVAGIYEREGSVIYNSALLFDREGRMAGKYRKIYLPREEVEGGLTAGSGFPVFDTDFGKVGMMICWDVQYTDVARALALRGAEVILMPIAGGSETLASARAIENHVFLVTSGFDIASMILDPTGKAVTRSEAQGTVATATIDLGARYLDPWLGDMRGRYFREVRTNLTVDPAGRR